MLMSLRAGARLHEAPAAQHVGWIGRGLARQWLALPSLLPELVRPGTGGESSRGSAGDTGGVSVRAAWAASHSVSLSPTFLLQNGKKKKKKKKSQMGQPASQTLEVGARRLVIRKSIAHGEERRRLFVAFLFFFFPSPFWFE
jgi:hypothetical protein